MPYFGVLWANIGVFFAPIYFFIEYEDSFKRFSDCPNKIGKHCPTS